MQKQIQDDIYWWNNKTFCVMPWISILGRQNGNYSLCCVDSLTESSGLLWNIQDTKFEKLWNSDMLKAIRVNMLAWKKLENCKKCYFQEEAKKESLRQRYLLEYAIILKDIFRYTWQDWYYNQKPQRLELMFSNLCNFSCKMCSSISSFRTLEQQIEGDKYNLLQWFWQPSKLQENLEYLLPSLKYIHVSWWEPFIDRDFLSFLQYIKDSWYIKSIFFSCNTNLSFILPYDTIKLFLSHMISVSCDGFWEIYNYIREWWNWSQLKNNLKMLRKKGINFELSVTLQADNILNYPLLWIFAKNNDYKIMYNFLMFPESYNVLYISNSFKEHINKIYLVYLEKYNWRLRNELREELHEILRYISLWKPKMTNYQERTNIYHRLYKKIHPDGIEVFYKW